MRAQTCKSRCVRAANLQFETVLRDTEDKTAAPTFSNARYVQAERAFRGFFAVESNCDIIFVAVLTDYLIRVAAARYGYCFTDEAVAAAEVDFIAFGNYGVSRFFTRSTVDTNFFNRYRRLICCNPERRGVYVVYLFAREVSCLSIQCVNAFFQID